MIYDVDTVTVIFSSKMVYLCMLLALIGFITNNLTETITILQPQYQYNLQMLLPMVVIEKLSNMA